MIIGGGILGIEYLESIRRSCMDIQEQAIITSLNREGSDMRRWLYLGVKLEDESAPQE